jgi:hypothetical protein
MEINPTKSKADHRAALKEIEALMSARKHGTPIYTSKAGKVVAIKP